MALVTRIITLLGLISEIFSLRFEPHTGGGMIFFSNHDSIIKNLEKTIEIRKKTLKRGNSPSVSEVIFLQAAEYLLAFLLF